MKWQQQQQKLAKNETKAINLKSKIAPIFVC